MNHSSQENSMDKRIAKEINLKELYRVIKKRLWLVALITILATIAGWFYGNVNKGPLLYQTSTNIIIGADAEYRKTLQVIIKDTVVLEKVIKELGVEKSPEALASQINVESIDESQVVKISATDLDPEQAVKIANTTAKVFKEEILAIVGFKNVRILSGARFNPNPINESNGNKVILTTFILGIIAGIGLVFLIDSQDHSIKSENDIEKMLGVQVIGSVSRMSRKNISKRKSRQTKLKFRGETIGFK
ncbi:capsular biosynthesis protein [Bacillus aerolatus]|uniref:Capsular biosynthesis protein n=1 Tax=Bacillus aerolatus TaxID=2653354 RepID=A0A6I1FI98_9BACI|nr:capsular biosynthesis protein [Bacillus aerolatus]KAB7708161.1 capsular biosynthesis protein [Bacillus aerolatus]